MLAYSRRKPARRALVAAAAMALASCGGPSTERPPTETVTSTITSESTPSTSSSPSTPTSTSGAPSAKPPGKESNIAEIAAWIEAGQAADPSKYQTVHDHRYTPPSEINIGQGVAFMSPSKKISCVGGRTDETYARLTLAFSCLVGLQNPPPSPKEFGEWIGGWVDYDGTAASVGSFHGDPGVFNDGDGAELPYGQRLSFRNGSEQYTCRMDQTGLWCANKAKGSAVLLNDQGLTPYGCLKQIPHKEGEGLSYAC